MKRTCIVYLLSFLLHLYFGTHAYAQLLVKFTMNDFDKVLELKGEKVVLENPLMNPYEILLLDTLLFVKNIQVSPAVDVINLNTGKTISQFCKKGKGPGELIAPFCIQLLKEDNEIMVQDIQGKKIVFYDIGLILNNTPKKDIRTIHLDKSTLIRKLVVLDNGNLFCNLIGHANGYMNALFNSEGALINYLDKYPELNISFNPTMGSNLFATNIGTSYNCNKIILPYTYSKQIDIYDKCGNKTIAFKGPDYKDLDVVNHKGRASITSNNNRAYNIPCVNTKSFMIPYSGEKRKYAFSPASHIFHFSFEGKLIQHIKLSPSVTEIAVDWENGIIYGVNKNLEPTLYKYNF